MKHILKVIHQDIQKKLSMNGWHGLSVFLMIPCYLVFQNANCVVLKVLYLSDH